MPTTSSFFRTTRTLVFSSAEHATNKTSIWSKQSTREGNDSIWDYDNLNDERENGMRMVLKLVRDVTEPSLGLQETCTAYLHETRLG